MALPDPKSHRISLEEAAAQTRRHREARFDAGLFLRDEVQALLAQPGCAGVRFYWGRKADGQESIVLVGVDKDGNDLIQGMVLDNTFWCPPLCSAANVLNS